MTPPGPYYHTLLVTADQPWSLLLYEHLTSKGFAPLTVAATGDSALMLFRQLAPRLVLIDLNLPETNGFDLGAVLFLADSTVKVILITETLHTAPMLARSAGIAGYIGRALPLVAWAGLLTYIMQGGMALNQNMVETALAQMALVQKRPPPLVMGELQIDLAQRLVFYAGQRIRLTAREFALLIYLVNNPDRVITVDQLLSDAWGYDSEHGTPAQVRLYITRLRRKLLADAQMPDAIRTVRGIGYRLDSAAL